MDLLESIFSLLCGQNPAHTWVLGEGILQEGGVADQVFGEALLGGGALPCCQRCTGLYAGLALGVLLQIACRPRPTSRFLWAHAMLLLQMVPLGFGLVPQLPVVRALSGGAFAVGLVAFLWLPLSPAGDSARGGRSRNLAYAACGLVGIALVPALALWGGAPAGVALSFAAAAGLLALPLLAALAVLTLAGAARSMLLLLRTSRESGLP